MPKKQLTEQEWSHFFDIRNLGKSLERLHIEASEEELEDLARRLGVEAVKSAAADLVLTREKGGHKIYISGRFSAVLTQNCVVTLEPFDITLSEEMEGWFGDKESAVSFVAAKHERDAVKARGEIEILEEKDDPESIVSGLIDLGEFVTQHISLSIPPYPHKDGVQYEYGDEQAEVGRDSPLRKNPFEALKDWKEKR